MHEKNPKEPKDQHQPMGGLPKAPATSPHGTSQGSTKLNIPAFLAKLQGVRRRSTPCGVKAEAFFMDVLKAISDGPAGADQRKHFRELLALAENEADVMGDMIPLLDKVGDGLNRILKGGSAEDATEACMLALKSRERYFAEIADKKNRGDS